ncbi:MAG TPA: outer membrane beta-barrel protein [Flavipsychrobacter sp.]|nr:outer membrane beta-barrel protein [Flavipsychrobacter sp.]
MRLLKLTLTFLLLSSTCSAQTSNASLAQKGKVIITPQAGIGLSLLLYNTVNDYYQTHGRAPRGDGSVTTGRWMAGLHIGYMLTRKIGLVSGLVYDNSSWKFEATTSRDYKRTAQHRIQVPLLLHVQKLVDHRGGYYLNGGVNVSFLQRINDHIYGGISKSDPNEFSKIAGALQLNPGIIISPKRQISATLGVDVQCQVTNNFSAPGLQGNLFSAAVVLGVRWISSGNTATRKESRKDPS